MPGRTSRGAIQIRTPRASRKAARSFASSRLSELWLTKTWLIGPPLWRAGERYPHRSALGNSVSSLPARAEHFGDRDELLARAPLARPRRLRRLDPLPVAEGDDVDAARLEQSVEPGPALLSAAAGRVVGGDLLGDLIAVGAVGADRARRPPPRPADAIEPVADHAVAVGEPAAVRFIGHALDRRRLVADAAHHQPALDLIRLAGADRGLALVEPRLLDDQPLDLAVALDPHGLGEEVEQDGFAFAGRLELGELAQMGDRLALPRLEQRVVEHRREIVGLHLRHRILEVTELAQFLGGHRDLVRPAPAEHVDISDRRGAERAEG